MPQKYLLFESRDPIESKGVLFTQSMAKNLIENNNEVVIFLVENGVFVARQSRYSLALEKLKSIGVAIWVDDFSLQERGITENCLTAGLQIKSVDDAVMCLTAGYKSIWH